MNGSLAAIGTTDSDGSGFARATADATAPGPNAAADKMRSPGGESVSQSPLKDNAFLTFVNQKPLFELPPESGFSSSTKACFANSPHRQKCRQRLASQAGESDGIDVAFRNLNRTGHAAPPNPTHGLAIVRSLPERHWR